MRQQGGYNIDAIAASALECVKVLLGEIPPQMPSMRASEEATEAVHEVQLIQSQYWNSIQPTNMSKEGKCLSGRRTAVSIKMLRYLS